MHDIIPSQCCFLNMMFKKYNRNMNKKREQEMYNPCAYSFLYKHINVKKEKCVKTDLI